MSSRLALPDHQSENRPQTGRKAPRTAFLPGRSGNPGGRPKKTEEEFQLIQACQQKASAALAQIERLMLTAQAEKVWLGAAVFIIERQRTPLKHFQLGTYLSCEKGSSVGEVNAY